MLACGGPPELVAERRAVDAFREGRAHLNEPARARKAFERARAERPAEPLLTAWVARARADEGDLEGAIDELEALLVKRPSFGIGHYNLACWRARAGRPEEAAVALRKAFELGATTAKEAVSDPDLQPFREHPAFGFLPRELLTVSVEAPESPVFWGSNISVRLKVLGSDDHEVILEAERARGPLQLLAVTENVFDSSEGRSRDIRFDFRVVGAGAVEIGPLKVVAGPWTASVPVISFPAAAPAGREGESVDLDLALPAAIRGDWACGEECWSAPAHPARRDRDVLTAGSARIEPAGAVRYAFQVHGRPRWSIHRGISGPATVRSVGSGAVVLPEP